MGNYKSKIEFNRNIDFEKDLENISSKEFKEITDKKSYSYITSSQ